MGLALRGGESVEFVVAAWLRSSVAIFGITIFGITIFGITVFSTMQYIQTISCIFGEYFVEKCDSILKVVYIRLKADCVNII